MGDENDWKKASTEEKVEHKNWKARVEGYEECYKLFRLADDPKNPIYLNYLGLVKKFVIDSNEVARDKALDAVLAFVENIPAASKTAGEVLPGLIAKCLNGKAKTKEKAFEIILMYIEAEKQETVQEELIKGLDNKQPKIVQACLELLKRAISEFSSKTIPIKPIIKFVPKLLEDRDKSVRDETKLLAVEMYRWAGAAIMPQLQSIKPSLLQELEDAFKEATATGEKPRQTRFLRSQQDLKAKMEAEMEARGGGDMASGGGGGGDAGGDGGQDAVDESIDPYELMEPAEILSKLPKDFKEKLEAKKWQERKEVLDALLTILQKNPRLQVTDYYELANDLKKIVAKDANVNIVVVAAKCITGLASGLRKDFSKYALMCLEPLMERFKEKKQNIVDAMREACDAIYPSTNLEAIQEMCAGFLAHKTPVVRQQVALFLVRCFAMSTQATLPKKILKLYLPPLIKNLSEADPSVRDSSAEALGAIYKTLGEKIFVPQVPDLEPAKLDKIKEFAEKVVLLNARGEPRAVQAAAKPASAPAAAKVVPKGPTITKPSGDPPKAAAKPDAAKKDAGPKKVVKGGGGGGDKKEEKKMPEEPDLASETVDERAIELFGAECVTSLGATNWKERQSGLETMASALKRMIPEETPVQVVVRTLAKKPGFKDSHFQVLKQRLELVATLADTGYKFSQRSASYCLADIADKIGDVKTSQPAKDALAKIAEQCTLAYVCQQCLGPILVEGKNPKNQEQALLWLCQAIVEFGYQGMDTKALVGYIKTSLQNSNQSVRSAAVQLVAVIYMYLGANFRGLFDQEKPALLEQIDAEIEKRKGEKAPVPTRGKNVPSASAGSNGDGGDGEGGDDEESNDPIKQQLAAEALMPRTDISNELTESLMDQLNDKNWKERQAALEKLETILRDNKFIEPNLNELPTHLNKRVVDTNKILATTSLRICEKLAQALGSQGRRFVSTLAPGMIGALCDAKEALRKAAVSALNAWHDSCGGLAPFIEGDLLTETMAAATNPNIKAELCGWLCTVLPKHKTGKLPPELKQIIPHVFAYIEDRNPDVRAKAQELLVPLMTHSGPNEMLRAMQKCKPTSVTVLQPLIEKARAEVIAKQQAAAPPPAAPKTTIMGGGGAKKPAAKDLYADDDFEASAPPPKSESKSELKKETAGAKTGSAKPGAKDGKDAKSNGPSGASSASSTSKKKGGEEEDASPAMQVSNKNKRMDEEKALKTLKWNFDVPRKEFVEQLKTQMEVAGFNRTLQSQLFHDDFKYHIVALQTLTKAIDDLSDATVSNLDLLLRWLTLRFFETNPTVMMKMIEYMQALFTMLQNRKYTMSDYEGNAFVPYFVGKLGDTKDPIRKGFRVIIKQITLVFAPVKVYNFLIQALGTKNSRQRSECIEELGQMIETFGLQPFNPAVTLKEIAKQIGDRDTGVRNAALNTITVAFQIQGEQVYKFIGKLNEKDQSMLDERIKRTSKNMPPGGTGVKSSQSGQINQVGSASTAQMPNSASLTSISGASSQNLANGHAGEGGPSTNGHRTTARYNTTPRKGQSLTQQILPTPSSSSSLSSAAALAAGVANLKTSPTSTTGATTTTTRHRGEFHLDIKDDDDDRDGIIPVKISTHKDLDDLLNQPIGLPPPRRNISAIPVNLLKDSQDCREAIDLVITHISHTDHQVAIQNLLQIDVVIKDKEKKELLVPHVDNLINTCSVKLNIAHNVYLNNSPDCQVELVFKLFKGIFHVLMDLFESGLARTASVKSLHDVFYNLLSVMTDPKVVQYPDGDQLIRAINLVTLKLLECSEQTTCYCALVKLLAESCASAASEQQSKYLELVMKCIWRQIRRLSPQNGPSNGPNPSMSGSSAINHQLIAQIDTAKVLGEIHQFFRQFPSSSWQSRGSDLPLRTIKTLVFHLAKGKQEAIMDDLAAIQAPDDSEIKVYIMKLFRNGFQLAASAANSSLASTSSINSSTLTMSASRASKQQRLSTGGATTTSDQIMAVFRKINSADSSVSKEGVRELYDLKQQHPDIDIDKYCRGTSSRLKSYVDEQLRLIEQERSPPSSSSSSSGGGGGGGGGGASSSSSSSSALGLGGSSSTLLTTTTSTKPRIELDNNNKPVNRRADDIMKTIADWKSKTQLNKLDDDDDNDENNIRTAGAHHNSSNNGHSDMRIANSILTGSSLLTSGMGGTSTSTQRLFQAYQTNGGSGNGGIGSSRLNLLNRPNAETSENSIKAEKYLDIVKDLKKKYTRSRTECDQLGSIDQNLKNSPNENSTSNTNLAGTGQDMAAASGAGGGDDASGQPNYAQMQPENLYDEYRRRLELIKNIKKVK